MKSCILRGEEEMERIICEACGSPELVLLDGIYVCRACGSRYMAQSSSRLNNLLTLARRARKANNIHDANKYYNEAKIEAPNNWEVIFFSGFFAALCCSYSDKSYNIHALANSLGDVCQLIKQTVPDSAKQTEASNEIVAYIKVLVEYQYDATREDYLNKSISYEMMIDIMASLMSLISSIAIMEGSYFENYLVSKELYEKGITLAESWKETVSLAKIPREGLVKMRPQITAAKEEMRKKYWLAHAKEKEDLEHERETIKEQLAALQTEVETLNQDIWGIRDRIQELNKKKQSFGIFKSSEKKAVQEEIERIQLEENRLDQERDKLLSKKTIKEKRLQEIKNELEMDRLI